MYAREAGDRRLTLVVSGMLWQRSLVMMDQETRSLWSHILGEAMDGPLKGTRLEMLPSDMLTWEAWRKRHPDTTVLNLSRTHRDFVRDFYRRPADFVFGLVEEGQAYHVPFPVMQRTPILNLNLRNASLLVTFDPQSTAARVFSRDIEGRTLTFVEAGEGRMRDEETMTHWDRDTGEAVEGPLRGRTLQQRVGIVSFTRAWNTFHPESKTVQPQ